ncbi:FAD-binding oxidoreductase [Occultella gossypii]|uniref:FAD-dependent oxidoreductase n=1 Tax=Occultella gossypii TaxID=2800820 RepID=A0ABS7SDI7_9MICO|nr:FAD-dependent oxidoreductase [Occultella gossypii]MBZ2198404.1 FAD-dependent oxidoreductase [Occultella gossypii]
MTILPQTTTEELRASVRGRVWLPADAGFDEVHRPWNLAIEQRVRAVVEVADAADVSRLVRFASERNIPVATQPSGHGATGRASDAILLRTAGLDTIDIDPIRMTARIGAGVRSGELQRAAAAHGLTALPGSSPAVTVTGAALGGGLSWFGRAFGWMADSILAAEIVAADGTTQRVTPAIDPELFWALRGGGGDLAIVTALELQLRPAPSVFGGRQLWPATHAGQVAAVFRSMTETAPGALTLWLELLSFPGAEPLVAIDSTFLGDEATARNLMHETSLLPVPLSDTRAPISVADLGTITAEPTDPGPGASRGELLTHLDDSALAALVDDPIAPLMTVQIRHLGGALAQPSDSPHGALAEPYAVYMFGVPATAQVAESIAGKQAALADALPTSGRKPITFLNPGERLSDALPDASMRRLRQLKEDRDPDGIIRGNFGILD